MKGKHYALALLALGMTLFIGIYYFAFSLAPEPPIISPVPSPVSPIEPPPTLTPPPENSPAPTPPMRPTPTTTPLPIKIVIKTSTPTATPTLAATPTPVIEACHIETNALYTIRPGDTLWHIAGCAYDDPFRWVELCDFNGLANCDLIHAGNSLVIPGWW